MRSPRTCTHGTIAPGVSRYSKGMITEAPRGSAPAVPPSTAAHSAAAASFAALLGKLDYLGPTDIESIRLAYRFADEAHLGQLRKNGDPYITHPIAVAAQCAE